jgi:hypothetical protein
LNRQTVFFFSFFFWDRGTETRGASVWQETFNPRWSCEVSLKPITKTLSSTLYSIVPKYPGALERVARHRRNVISVADPRRTRLPPRRRFIPPASNDFKSSKSPNKIFVI